MAYVGNTEEIKICIKKPEGNPSLSATVLILGRHTKLKLFKKTLNLENMKRYFPVLLSKAGELTALSNLTQNVKDEIAPVIQVLADNFDRVEAFASANWTFDDNQLFLDFSLCDPFNRVATRRLITNLVGAGSNVIPVLQSNSNPTYSTLLQTLIGNGTISNVCMRFSNGSGGFININAQVATMLGTLENPRKLTPSRQMKLTPFGHFKLTP